MSFVRQHRFVVIVFFPSHSKICSERRLLFKKQKEGKYAVVKSLVEEKKVNINSKDEDDRTAFHWACASGHLEIVIFLYTSGANANTKDDSNWTPLMSAASAEHVGVVNFLLNLPNRLDSQSIDVNAQNENGKSALFYAVSKGNVEMVKLLLERKDIDLKARDKYGRTLLHSSISLKSAKNAVTIIDMLIKKGISVNCQDSNGDSPLHFAVQENNQTIASLLIEEYDADVNIRNKVRKNNFKG